VRSVKFDDQRIAKRMHPIPVAAKPMMISERSTIDLRRRREGEGMGGEQGNIGRL
jgi:hypothetical protein